MNKIRAVAVSLVLLLLFSTGCARDSKSDVPKDNKSYILMDTRVPLGDGGNLWYIPNTTTEEMEYPYLYAMGEDLLLQSYVNDEESCPTSVILKRISLTDGTLLAQTEVPCSGSVMIQTSDDSVSLADPSGGIVTILNEQLSETARYQINGKNCSWRLSTDQKTLFCFDEEAGIYAVDLTSKTERDILSNAIHTTICKDTPEYVVFSYVDSKSQMYHGASLNLKTGTVEEAPLEGELYSDSVRQGDSWILSGSFLDGSDYILHTSKWEKVLTRDERNNMLMFVPSNRLLTDDLTNQTLTLYDSEGAFLSDCTLPKDEERYLSLNFVWSEYWNGYFFLQLSDDGGRLLFWDTKMESIGSDLPLQDKPETTVQGGVSTETALYTRAAQLSERFDVDIRIADQCRLNYDGCIAREDNDTASITNALDVLEETLASYPKGFFKQIPHGSISFVRIELVADFEMTDDRPVIDGITFDETNYCLIVLDTQKINAELLYHEVSHVIDKRLAWDAFCRSDALYSEDAWLALQPEGFDYGYSYMEISGELNSYAESGYFTEQYAMTFPTEDRATVLAAAIAGSSDFPQDSPLWKKLDFYCRCIRDCFYTTNWPAETCWESALHQ